MNSGHEYEIRLVERFRHGDSEAAATLFEMYVDHMYRYAQHVLGNREDAEEVASEGCSAILLTLI